MTQDPQVAQGVSESADDALIACLTEIERFVASSSWGGPPRLFALVRTVDLVKAEPALAGQLAIGSHDSLSSIEQDDFRPGDDLAQALATTTWGDAVDGAAICVERIFLPDDCADEIPHDPEKAAAFVAAHPKRQGVRVVAGALRDGSHYGVARLVEHPDELLGSIDLVPALESAVLETLR
ncbi:MAG: hypothetical protein DI553_04265 [Cutibacterium acnes]|nr:hypothetical protein HMPREF9947_0612 [Propionibacterium sp. 409-HC1]EGR89378.1 hypothetical protein HMPREF9949_2114 [Propionibacterium sp. CC003-HC2]PZQ74632.1 MAG: hypothetical protein DI553_04265 [Cutibacterium acnes]